MLAKYFSFIRNCVSSVYFAKKVSFYHQQTLLDAFRTNFRNVIGRNHSMVIPLLAIQDLTSMLNRPNRGNRNRIIQLPYVITTITITQFARNNNSNQNHFTLNMFLTIYLTD